MMRRLRFDRQIRKVVVSATNPLKVDDILRSDYDLAASEQDFAAHAIFLLTQAGNTRSCPAVCTHSFSWELGNWGEIENSVATWVCEQSNDHLININDHLININDHLIKLFFDGSVSSDV